MIGDVRWDVDRLRVEWQSDATLASKLNDALDAIGFDDRFSRSGTPATGKKKYLKDSVWGMVEFDHAAIQLIDSPLLQRLRGVRQLGFSYLVYPSAEHTRFIHSLGMAHVVASFVDSIGRNAGTEVKDKTQVASFRDVKDLLPLTAKELVTAALLHDVGHMPFSHACEAALAQQDHSFTCGGTILGDFLTRARLAFKKDISLSEALSILIVLSKRFAEFYGRLATLEPGDRDASLVRIACLIAGVPATDSCPNIQDLISAAAVDADKIDYVARDAAACGIAVGVDTSRIFMGSALVEARRDAYDPSYEGDATGIVFIVNSSGADTLDEIVQARSALYQRVYLHPVTRTAEALLSRALYLNAAGSGCERQVDLTDALGLWALDDASLLQRLAAHDDGGIAALARRLKRRTLPKKACALAGSVATMHMPLRNIFPRLDPNLASAIKKDVANTFVEELRRERIGAIGAAEIERRIRAEAEKLADALKRGGKGDLVPPTKLDLVVVTPIAAMDGSRPDALVFQAGELIRTPALTNVQGQHDAQDIFKAVGYVFCDSDWRALVLLAARRIVLELSEEFSGGEVRHEIAVTQAKVQVAAKRRTVLEFEDVSRRANIPRSVAEKFIRGAAEVSHFDDLPILYLPTDAGDSNVQTVAKTFRGFAGQSGWSVDRVTVAAFVDQFPPRLRSSMLDMLKLGTLLDQAALAGALEQALEKLTTFGEKIVACPLSSSSGGEAVAILKRLGLPNVSTCMSLGEAIRVAGDPLIVLVDDNAASGVQASAQLYAHLGVERADRPTKLAKEDGLFEGVLRPEDIQALGGKRLAIAVAAGLDDADREVRKTAEALGLGRFEWLVFGRTIAEGLQWPDELKDYLLQAGRDLMAYRYARCGFDSLTDPEVAERCNMRAFGYGGRGGIMATQGNVPSSTVTALWQPGLVRGRPWMPLLLRRGLLEHLVLG